jgi:hypothetical protein
MNLTDEEKLALVNLLERTIRDDPYPLSPRIRQLQGILDKVEPPQPRPPLPPLKVYEPPRTIRGRRR